MIRLLTLLVTLFAFASHSQAAIVTLYDGSGLPSEQGWMLYATDFAGSAVQTAVAGGVSLATDDIARAGYSNTIPMANQLLNPLFPNLDRSLGFELEFTLRVNGESHLSDERAGFSLILTGSDNQGIELGFWTDRIWAQTSDPLFTQGAGVATDTTLQRDYRLRIFGGGYTLFAGADQLLSGSVEDYSSFGTAPYTLSNYLFMGDNTTGARADILLGPVAIQSDLSAVPEPASLNLVLAAAVFITPLRQRRQATGANTTAREEP